MFSSLKRRLVLLYGITSSIILTTIIIGIYFISNHQSQEQHQVLFQKNVEQIVEKIRNDNKVDNTWLVNMQIKNKLIIFIESNGKRLNSYNHVDISPDMEKIITKMKELAAKERIYLNQRPFVSEILKTSVYNIPHGGIGYYLCMASLIPKDNSWLNIMAIHNGDQTLKYTLKQIFLFSTIDFIGVAALFLISTLYIGKVLTPLEQGQQKQKEFIAAASHELRSPLTVIKAGVTSIKEDIAKAEQFLPHIDNECNRMTRLINDMLLLANADAKTWGMNMDQVDMDTLLIESYDMFCSYLNKNKYKLSLQLPEEPLHLITGDRERIKQILAILIDNALSYTPTAGNIAIHSYNQKHAVILEVEDHGIGIPDEDKPYIFERFFRGNKSRNDKNHFGLGLSIAKELADLHKGNLSVKNTPGGGATFILELPW